MSLRPPFSIGVAATALFLAGCDDTASDQGDEHGHGHHDHDNAEAKADHDDAHGHGGHDHAKPTAPASAANGPASFPVGAATATLTATDSGLRLTLTDASGAAVAASGEARVVLTGTGEEPQRVVLKPDGDGWAGSAKAAGAPGYVAVVSLDLGGHTETGRTSWGSVPAVEAAP